MGTVADRLYSSLTHTVEKPAASAARAISAARRNRLGPWPAVKIVSP